MLAVRAWHGCLPRERRTSTLGRGARTAVVRGCQANLAVADTTWPSLCGTMGADRALAGGGRSAVRVVGGEFAGRRLQAPRDRATRPTSDLVRGAVFAALESLRGAAGLPGLVGCAAADLYAGTGALGLEALSRGCREVWLVESRRPALAVLRANVAALGLEARAHILPQQVERVLEVGGLERGRPEVVLADPPYAVGVGGVLRALGVAIWLPSAGVVVLEHHRREELPRQSGTLRTVWQRAYGDTAVTIFASEQRGAGGNGSASGPLSGEL